MNVQVSAEGSVRTELIEDDGESRYKITDIIGGRVYIPLAAIIHVCGDGVD